MPWDVKKRGDEYCVVKQGESSPVPGGCHSTRAAAVKHQRALYASEASAEEGTVMNVETQTSNGDQGALRALATDNEWETIENDAGDVIGFKLPEGVSIDELKITVDADPDYITDEPVTVSLRADARTDESIVDSNLWEGPLGVIGHPTSDNRFLIPDEIGNRDLPLPLNVQTVTDEGHQGSESAGRINTIELIRMGDFEHAEEFSLDDVDENAIVVWGTGEFDGSPAAEEAKRLISNGYGVSLDLPPDRIAYFDPETKVEVAVEDLDEMKVFFGEYLHGIGGKIAGATVVNIPAFSEATIRLAEDMVLVASAGQIRQVIPSGPIIAYASREWIENVSLVAGASLAKPPREAFEDPGFRELTPLTIGDPLPSGHRPVYGHLADWDGCHTGFTNVCVPPFRSNSNYAYFNTGEIECDDGSKVPIGKLMFSLEGAGHAPTDPSYGAVEASKFYDDATKIGGFVRAGTDRFGTWLAGVMRHDLSDEELLFLRANPPSGDWRPIPGKPGSELVAAFSVPVGGFPIPRMMVASADNGLTIITGPLDVTPGPRAIRRQTEVLRRRRKRWAA